MSRKPTSKTIQSDGFNVAELERLMGLMDRHQLAELEVEQGDRRVVLRTRDAFSGAPTQIQTALSRPTVEARTEVLPSSPAAVLKVGNEKQINSPFVGVFYRAATPGGDPLVREGQPVKKGDVLCIVEAMKLMNEIEAEWPGKITKVLVENGQAVEFGEPLFTVEPA